MDEEQPNMGDEQPQSQPAQVQEEAHQVQVQTKKRGLSRRQFLAISAVSVGVVGTGLVIGFNVLGKQNKNPQKGASSFAPNVWVRINADNTVIIQVGKSEMGQGVMTALPMLLAEELDADWSKVRVEQPDADAQYGDQLTDGSTSVSESFASMRNAGAIARALLVIAAAQTWGVDSSTCRTEKGVVIHSPTGKRASYGDLVGVASTVKLDADAFNAITLKQPEAFTLIGTSVPRVDTPMKTDGSARFGLDVRVPGMRYATVARCPFLGGSLDHVDSTKASAVPGVLQVLQIKSGVAVVAQNTWAAIQGRQALEITWNPGSNAQLDSTQLQSQLAAAVQSQISANGGSARTGSDKTVEAEYVLPYLAHATMEPMNCTADVHADHCEVWAPTQHPQAAQQAASLESGLPLKDVAVHVTFAGGGFGRRTYTDFVAEAVQISKAVSAPVQVVWTRDDDLQHDFYRPASYHHLSATLTTAGLLTNWVHTIAIAELPGLPPDYGADVPYTIAPASNNGSRVSLAVPTGIWRSVNYANNIFAMESFIDEVAAAGGLDPYQLRMQLLSTNTRLQNVVQLAASKAGWGTPLPAGWGRGIAFSHYITDTPVAEVAEVSVASDGSVQVHRVVCAVDCGMVVHPSIATAQIEGAVIDGLTAALKGEITVANGQIQQHSFGDYPLLRMNESPVIEVYFVPSTDGPDGLGEPGLPPIAPAVANAIFAATGKRVRRLPIRPDDLR